MRERTSQLVRLNQPRRALLQVGAHLPRIFFRTVSLPPDEVLILVPPVRAVPLVERPGYDALDNELAFVKLHLDRGAALEPS